MGILDSIGTLDAIGVAKDVFNLGAGVENSIYARKMQKEAWKREDTAVQRRVADLKAAGMSPILAAGAAASSSAPISVKTPEADLSGIMLGVQKRILDSQEKIARSGAIEAENKAEMAFKENMATPDTVFRKRANTELLAAGVNLANAKTEDFVRTLDFYKRHNLPWDSAGADVLGPSLLVDSLTGGMNPEGDTAASALLRGALKLVPYLFKSQKNYYFKGGR